MNFDDLAAPLVVLKECVDLLLVVAVLDEELLDPVVVKEVFLPHAEDFKGLYFGHKSSLDS